MPRIAELQAAEIALGAATRWTAAELGRRAAEEAWAAHGLDAPRAPSLGACGWLRVGLVLGRVLSPADQSAFRAAYREALHARFMG